MGTTNHGGVMPTRLVNGEHFAAMATKLLADGKL
jgi:hypothetical protein